jgi:hypothetical protein
LCRRGLVLGVRGEPWLMQSPGSAAHVPHNSIGFRQLASFDCEPPLSFITITCVQVTVEWQHTALQSKFVYRSDIWQRIPGASCDTWFLTGAKEPYLAITFGTLSNSFYIALQREPGLAPVPIVQFARSPILIFQCQATACH